MRSFASVRVHRLVSGTVAALAVAALVAASSTSAAANDTGVERDGAPLGGQEAVLTALERDLGLDRSEVDSMLDALSGVDELAESLETELGDSFAGLWFDHEAGATVVAVTDTGAATTARAAGARPTLVAHSKDTLDEIHAEVGALMQEHPEALADAFSWTVDVQANQVVVTVRSGSEDTIDALVGQYGDAVQVVGSAHEPQRLNHDGSWLDGGVQYNNVTGGFSCSVGFNAHNPNTGQRFFLSAGHCGLAGHQTAHGGTAIGPFAQVRYPGSDDALVQVTNSSWDMGPFVWTYPGKLTIQGAASSPVGTPICKSGMTTQVTCGTITNKNVTVNYGDGPVSGLGQHNACAEPGDSGGSTYSTGGNLAEGMTSGGQLFFGFCLGRLGLQSVTFYQEVTDSLNAYSPVTLM